MPITIDQFRFCPSFGKIFEKIMKIKILDYIEKFKILVENQLCFRNRRSTVDALVNVVENINLEKEKGKNSTTVFLDLKKAFDTVNHSLLLKKLEEFGIRGQVLSWFFISQIKNTVCYMEKKNIERTNSKKWSSSRFCSGSCIVYTVL